MDVKIGSLVKFYIVLLLKEGPKHGYDLMKELEKKLGSNISASQVYPFLNTLKKNKLVRVEETGSRDRKTYKLTSKGEKFVEKILGRFGDLIDIAVEPRLSVCAHCGCKVYEGGHQEKINGKELNFCCHHCARSYKKER